MLKFCNGKWKVHMMDIHTSALGTVGSVLELDCLAQGQKDQQLVWSTLYNPHRCVDNPALEVNHHCMHFQRTYFHLATYEAGVSIHLTMRSGQLGSNL